MAISIKCILICNACAGVMVRPEEGNVYTSVEPTFSSNPNVYFQRTEPLHVGMMY